MTASTELLKLFGCGLIVYSYGKISDLIPIMFYLHPSNLSKRDLVAISLRVDRYVPLYLVWDKWLYKKDVELVLLGTDGGVLCSFGTDPVGDLCSSEFDSDESVLASLAKQHVWLDDPESSWSERL